MENQQYLSSSGGFNESEWIKLLFLLSDIQSWIDEMEKSVFRQLPLNGKSRLFRKKYYLSVGTLAHILERHYNKINRHPGAGKFTIPVPGILHYLKEASDLTANEHAGSGCFARIFDTGTIIGFDKNNLPTCIITILTDSNGHIKTAYPGSP